MADVKKKKLIRYTGILIAARPHVRWPTAASLLPASFEKGFMACHYARRVPASTADFRRAFGFAFVGDDQKNAADSGDKTKNINGMEGILRSLGLGWLIGGRGEGGGDNADPLAKVPKEDLATLNSVYDFVLRYGLAEEAGGESGDRA